MNEAHWIVSMLSRALAFGTPLLWGALGEIYAERSGVINLRVEGMMILGAFAAFAVAYTTGNPTLGLLMAAVVGGVAALLHAFVVITLRANQYVSGLALTMLGLGLAGLLGRGWEGLPLTTPLPPVSIPGLSSLPVLGPARWGARVRRMCDRFPRCDPTEVYARLRRSPISHRAISHVLPEGICDAT